MADRKFNAKMEKGEVFKAPDGVIEKIPNTAPAHEQADSIAPATLILENTSAIRKDPYSRMLKITPEQFQNLTGFKAKTDMSHSKAFEIANKKASKLIDKHAKYLNSPNKGVDNFATNTANLNQLFSQQILEGDELFQTLFDNQEARKTYYEQTTGDDFSSEKVIGSEYQYGGKQYPIGGYGGRKGATKEVADYQRNVLGLTGKDVDGVWRTNTQALYEQHINKVKLSLVPQPTVPRTPGKLNAAQARQMIGDVSYSSDYANDQFANMMNVDNNPLTDTARLLKNILGQGGNINFAGQDDPNNRVKYDVDKEKVRRILANIDTGIYAKGMPTAVESTRVQRRYEDGGQHALGDPIPVMGNLKSDNPYLDYQKLLFNQSGMVGSQHPNEYDFYGNVTSTQGLGRVMPNAEIDPRNPQDVLSWQQLYNANIKNSTDWLEKVGYVKPLEGLDIANQLRFSENPNQVNSMDGKLGEFTSNRQRLKMRVPGTKAGIYALDQIGINELKAAGVTDPNILQHLSDSPDASLLVDVEVVPGVDSLKPNQTQIPTLEGKMQPVDPQAAFSIKPNTPEEKVATTPPTGPAVGNPEKAKFNQPLNWYDVAGDTMGLLNSLVRDPEKYNPAQVHQLQLQLQDITPALRQNQSDYNALLQQLPDNQTGFINAANAFKIKLQGANQASAQVNAANTQIRNQEIQYNTQVRDRQSLLDQQARAVFQDKVDTSKSKQDEQKQLYWDNIFNKIAQNAKLNRMGQMILNSNPSLNQDGTGNQAVIQQQLLNYLSGAASTPGNVPGFAMSRYETAGDGKPKKIVYQPQERVTKQNERKFTIK